ncbi:hypothetical protein DHD32_07270 [Arenibacter sp. TNZ]|nr:hypothetical protein [Arenibacter sp. TNZ]
MSITAFFTPRYKFLFHGLVITLLVWAVIHSMRSTLYMSQLFNYHENFKYYNVFNITIQVLTFYLLSWRLIPLVIIKRKKGIIYVVICATTYTLFISWSHLNVNSIIYNLDKPETILDTFLNFKTLFNSFLDFTPFVFISFLYCISVMDKTCLQNNFTAKQLEITGNIIVLLLIYQLFILNSGSGLEHIKIFLELLMFLLFFYLNVLFFGPVLLSDKKLGKYLFLIITSLIIIGIGTKLIYGIRYSPNLLVFAIHFMLTALLSLIYCYVRLKLKKDQLIFNLKLGAKDSELQLLKSQVNPHFLFNTLNTLYATALEENAPKTAESTAKLANLLRYMQNDITKDFIPLENEIKYLEDYITIQKLRCEVKPQVETIFKNCEGKTLSPGLLIPFVENAFKYGIDPSKPSKLKVSVICDASKINFECVNSYDDNFNTYYKEQGFGMGIKNAKQRLDLVYPKNYTLDISKANHIFTVKLNITSNK